jgi:tRNA pseudouridine55 synthase
LQSFQGPNDQLPPPFSAKKVGGRPLYKYARRGQTVSIRPSRVIIHDLRMIGYEPPFLDIGVHAASGTYIRSLAHDLGQRLGCGAHLAGLRRTRVGDFEVESALPLVTLEERIDRGEAVSALIPLDLLLPGFPKVIVDEAGADWILHGRSVPAEHFLSPPEERMSGDDRSGSKGAEFRVLDHDGRLLGLARKEEDSGSLTPFVVFLGR